ncbi:MAG: protein TonB, partial [Gammaproteobacteria bacterium]
VLNSLELPEIAQKNLVDISPRLAKLILEKQKVRPPPVKEKKKEEVKKKEEKKVEEKKKEAKKETAREVAQQSGLIALKDELADLRDFSIDDVIDLPQQTEGKQEIKVATTSELLTSNAVSTSGGIKTDTLNRKIQTSELSSRATTRVESKIQTAEKIKTATSTKKTTTTQRSSDEIERVFQKNKGGIYSIYQRALRKNPSLVGKVVVELTIAPDGTVTDVKILSSELGDKTLEGKLRLKIKRFKFASANVPAITVTYPIDFLPS